MYQVLNRSEIYYYKNMQTGDVFGPYNKEAFLKLLYVINKQERLDWNLTGTDYSVDVIDYPYNSFETNLRKRIRKHLFFDMNGRIIDPRNYINEAIKYCYVLFNDTYFKSFFYGSMFYGKYCLSKIKDDTLFKKNKRSYYDYINTQCNSYEYRKDPVPRLHKASRKKCSNRCKGIKRIFTYATDPEYGKYVRKKAIPFNLDPWYWSDRYMKDHPSWKEQKKRKQWMQKENRK